MNLRVHSITARALAAASVVAILASSVACRSRARLQAVRVSRQPLVQSLVVSGRVMAPVRVNIGTTVMGTVSRRLVEEGERVEGGGVVVTANGVVPFFISLAGIASLPATVMGAGFCPAILEFAWSSCSRQYDRANSVRSSS